LIVPGEGGRSGARQEELWKKGREGRGGEGGEGREGREGRNEREGREGGNTVRAARWRGKLAADTWFGMAVSRGIGCVVSCVV